MTLAQQTYVPDDAFEAYLDMQSFGSAIPNNDSALTSIMNGIDWMIIPSLGISDLTGIEECYSLTRLDCSGNNLTSLDLSQSTVIQELFCDNNQLTSLDAGPSTIFSTLVCSDNQLTTLDCIKTSLIYLECANNQLTTLDLSQNTVLTRLWCNGNQLTCLDISNKPNLFSLVCKNNLLDQLNTKNGNWQNLTVDAINNNLTCLEVDNIGIATNSWSFDSFTTISTNCNYTNPCNSSTAIQEHTTNKELLKITDLLGRETNQTNQPLFYIYDDGTVEQRVVIE